MNKTVFAKSLISAMLLFVFVLSYSQKITITGKAPSYAGSSFQLSCWNDPLGLTSNILTTVNVAADGAFSSSFIMSNTQYVTANIGSYEGTVCLQPNRIYQLALPDKKEKTESDWLNPFFQPITINLTLSDTSSTELNQLISHFNDLYLPQYKFVAGMIHSRPSVKKIDSVVNLLTPAMLLSENEFYRDYILCKIGTLRQLAFQNRLRTIASEYFYHKPMLVHNPAWVELFNSTFDNYFAYRSRGKQGKAFAEAINVKQSYSALNILLQSDSVLQNDTLRQWVILKNIKEEFYSSGFSQQALLNVLDSLIETNKIDDVHRTALALKTNITRVRVGYPAADFKLLDSQNDTILLSKSFNGKYVYLNFCACQSYACVKEYDVIKKLYDKHGDKISFITIVCDGTPQQMTQFVKKNKYPWTFLHYSSMPQVLNNYSIRAFPTYYFIGRDGKFIYSPASSPSENFEYYLFKVLRANGDI